MKTVVVTGATSGIGLAVCRALLQNGYRLIGVGRSEQNCQMAVQQLSEEFPNCAPVFFAADLMQLSQVERVARLISSELEHSGGSLSALIHNAGCIRSWYATSQDGYEQQFALNHLASFLLTYYLLPCLKQSRGRILFTSSKSHKLMKMHWTDVMFQKSYRPLMAYKQSKLCNLLLAYALNNRLGDCGVRAYGIDPGLVNTDIGRKNTGNLIRLVWSIRKKRGTAPEVPAKTFLWLCSEATNPEGLYYHNCRMKRYSRQVNAFQAEKLFALSEKLCGISYEISPR
jgi:NAD(P)-dependent dehydrogenase (short-subunit alcohol dehydrogenase family)